MKNLSIIALLLLFAACSNIQKQNKITISSPDKKLTFNLILSESGEPSYTVNIKGKENGNEVIGNSALGLILDDQDFSKSLSVVDAGKSLLQKSEYEMQIGKRKVNKIESNERSVMLANPNGEKFKLVVRVFNDGFAFRYVVERANEKAYSVTKELTAFQIPSQGKAWIEPYDSLQKWGPGHEVGYENEIAIGTTSYKSTGWAFPALFNYNNLWCMLTESDTDTTYCNGHLSASCENGLYRYEFPWDHELYGIADPNPSGKGSFQTPWRVGIVGEKLSTVVESNMVYTLARPNELGDMSWVKPGRATWSWWGDIFSPTNVPQLKQYIDFASQMGWEYSLLDCNWHYIPEKEFKDLIDYAKVKNVGILLWYNSAGPYTRVYEVGPLDRVHTHELRMKEFAWLKSLGVKGIKVDFFQSDKQEIMKYYDGLAKDAAKFGLLFNSHSSTIPRGWARTFPNFISMEAVKGAEQYPQEDYTKKAPMWNTILPFTRNVIGPMDYTPMTFSDRGAANSEEPATANKDKTNARRLTTNGHELALSVVFECGIQHFADRANSYLAQPAEVIQFLKDIPVTWDDTKLLEGFPGKYISIARKKGDVYYVGTLNGIGSRRTQELNFNFLPKGSFTLNLIADGSDDRTFKLTSELITSKSKVSVEMLPYGGFVATIKKMNK